MSLREFNYDPLDEADEEGAKRWESESTQRKDRRWEENVVKRVLTAGGYGSVIKQLLFDMQVKTGAPRLVFDAFHDRFPHFPLWLYCHKIPYVFETTLADLDKPEKARKSKIYKNFLEAQDRAPDYWEDKPVGLVFEWLHAGGQHKIFHSYGSKVHEVSFGSRNEIPVEVDGNRKSFWLESLDHFLLNIGWAKSE